MGGINVKNTILERMLEIIAPHPCSGCAKVGSVLCDDCKYDIVSEPFVGCILCGRPENFGICTFHLSPLKRTMVIGVRTGTLENAINILKFKNVKAAGAALGSLLDETMPVLPATAIVVPIPTVASHIRQRGYDQVELFARRFAEIRALPYRRLLTRVTKSTQHTVDKSQRQQQSAVAFELKSKTVLKGKLIVLIDDIITTGSTLEAAARLFHNAGATVWAIGLAYQPLD